MPHTTPWGEIPEDGIVPIGAHTYAFYAPRSPFANSALVVGASAVLVFDANDVWCGRHLRVVLDSYTTGRPLRFLVLSHTHSDHAHGAHFFAPPARVFAREFRVFAREFARQRLTYWSPHDLQPFIDESPQYAEEYRPIRIVVPDESVEAVRRLDLGGVHVRLEPARPAHTPGDLAAVVEEDRIALCGDLLFNRSAAYVASGSLAGSLEALECLRRLDTPVYLPGHGPACGPEALDEMRAFLVDLREAVRAGRSRSLDGQELVADVCQRMERWQHLAFLMNRG